MWPNMKILKIQDSGRPPYWKSSLTVTQQPIINIIIIKQENNEWRIVND